MHTNRIHAGIGAQFAAGIVSLFSSITETDERTNTSVATPKRLKLENPAFSKANVWLERHRSRRQLARLDQRMLRDIGMTDFEVSIEVSKPFWKA